MNFGMPYQGSKNKLAKDIIEQMPPAEHFYDLFGGGGAITHCAVLSGKYKYVHYNEINPLVVKGFEMAINGEFSNENRWISREEFYQLKDTDPYVAICFSFGNNLVDYLYGKDIEMFKKAVHYSIFFNDNSLLKEYADLSDFNYNSENSRERRLELTRYLNVLLRENKIDVDYGISNFTILQSQSATERLENLERLKRLQSLESLNYCDVHIESNSVIYCDIPYKNTKKYCHNDFDYDKFYEWCKGKKNLFVSEYSMPPEFIEVWSKKHKSFMSATKVADSVEKLFTLKE